MAKKPKKTKKVEKKKVTRQKVTKKKPSPTIIVLGLLAVLAVALLVKHGNKEQGTPEEFSVSLSHCLVDVSEKFVECTLGHKTGQCNDDMTLVVQDGQENTMLSIVSDSLTMGDISVDDTLTARLTSVPGEPGIDDSSGCANVLLVCGEGVYAATSCSFT